MHLEPTLKCLFYIVLAHILNTSGVPGTIWCFINANPQNPHISPEETVSSPFARWENQGSERVVKWPKVIS